MKITKIKIEKPFKYLWLKSVRSVNLNAHCARCIIGEYDNRISPNIGEAGNIELEEEIYYLCGVSTPYVWKNNFHLAFRRKDGARVEYSFGGITVAIDGAEKIDFSKADIDKDLPHSAEWNYNTCRNWQFANKIARELAGIN